MNKSNKQHNKVISMKKLNGKKLLILGASNNEIDVVKMAKELGCYAIVTDYYDSWEENPAKYVADEVWHISWSDTEALENKCRENDINGVIGGFSEFRVEAMIDLCERLGLPCYITREQLEVTRDKDLFKKLCKKFGVPVVNEYAPDDHNIVFPVIIKPTDRGGSIGINVAYNADEYKRNLEYAYSMSPSKKVVVEDFIGDGVKFDCSYAIVDGEPILIETCDTTMLSKEKGHETLQKAWTFPSSHEKEYIEQVDRQVKSMLNSLGMRYGVANISFFYREGHFYVFETGFRLGGGHSFDYQRMTRGIDYLQMLIHHAVGEPINIDTSIPEERGVAVTYNIYINAKMGDTLNELIGENEVMEMPGVATFMKCMYKGQVWNSEKPSKILMITLCAANVDDLIAKVQFVNNRMKVSSSNLIYPIFAELTEEEIIKAYNIN